jgi:hypothetical protein
LALLLFTDNDFDCQSLPALPVEVDTSIVMSSHIPIEEGDVTTTTGEIGVNGLAIIVFTLFVIYNQLVVLQSWGFGRGHFALILELGLIDNKLRGSAHKLETPGKYTFTVMSSIHRQVEDEEQSNWNSDLQTNLPISSPLFVGESKETLT